MHVVVRLRQISLPIEVERRGLRVAGLWRVPNVLRIPPNERPLEPAPRVVEVARLRARLVPILDEAYEPIDVDDLARRKIAVTSSHAIRDPASRVARRD